MSTSWWQGFTKIGSIHPLGIMNICSKFHGNPCIIEIFPNKPNGQLKKHCHSCFFATSVATNKERRQRLQTPRSIKLWFQKKTTRKTIKKNFSCSECIDLVYNILEQRKFHFPKGFKLDILFHMDATVLATFKTWIHESNHFLCHIWKGLINTERSQGCSSLIEIIDSVSYGWVAFRVTQTQQR